MAGARIAAAMHEYGLLVFPGQFNLSPGQNLAFAHAVSPDRTLYPRERGDKADGSHDERLEGSRAIGARSAAI